MSETAEKLRETAARVPDVTGLARPHFERDRDARLFRLPRHRLRIDGVVLSAFDRLLDV